MRISMIKKEAKELLRGLNQKYLLFVVPIILSIFTMVSVFMSQ